MLSLISIRSKYLFRHPCLLFWTYLVIPILIIIITIISKLNEKEEIIPLDFKEPPLEIGIKSFKADDQYEFKDLEYYWPGSLLVVDKQLDCSKVNQTFYELTSSILNCSYSERDANNLTFNIFHLKKDKDKYKISLTCRDTPISTNYKLFEKNDLDQSKIIDPFFVKENYSSTVNLDKYEIFFQLQSLFTKLLIKLNGKEIESEFTMKLGYNPYPEHYRFTDSYGRLLASFFAFIFVLQFSLISYNFNLRMIDEKEGKLNLLLERQGISKLKYNISWLITFYVLTLLSILAFLIFIFTTIKFHFILPIITIILFSFSMYYSKVTYISTIVLELTVIFINQIIGILLYREGLH